MNRIVRRGVFAPIAIGLLLVGSEALAQNHADSHQSAQPQSNGCKPHALLSVGYGLRLLPELGHSWAVTGGVEIACRQDAAQFLFALTAGAENGNFLGEASVGMLVDIRAHVLAAGAELGVAIVPTTEGVEVGLTLGPAFEWHLRRFHAALLLQLAPLIALPRGEFPGGFRGVENTLKLIF